MMRKIRNFVFSEKFVPILLGLVTIAAYGLFIPFQGLFMDDWYILWFKHTFGALQFPLYFSVDRPFMGYLFTPVSYLLGNSNSPIVWHLFTLLTRWLVTISLWQLLNTVWPKAKRQNIWVCLLAAVFPGFTQQWFPVVNWFFFLCLAGFFFSITLMLKAIENKKRFWLYYVGSLIIGVYCLIAPEFYAGLELTRYVILWIWFSRSETTFKSKLSKTFRYGGIYLFAFLVFVIWRGFFFVSINHPTTFMSQFLASPLQFLRDSIGYLFNSLYRATLDSWILPFYHNQYPAKGSIVWMFIFVMIFFFILVLLWQLFFTKKNPTISTPSDKQWRNEVFWVSLFALVFSIFPFWSAGMQISTIYPFDRFLLAFIFGSCLLLVFLIELFGGRVIPAIVLISLAVSVYTGYQFQKANFYKNIWASQKDFYWQLIWRMPDIKPGTAVMAFTLPNVEYYSENSISAQLNWTYSNDAPDRKVPYQFIILDSPQDSSIPSLQPNQNYSINFRTYQFPGNTSKSIFINYELPGCMRVVDSETNPLSSITEYQNTKSLDAAKLTDLSLIGSTPSKSFHPPFVILKNESAHTWCYYFEKADLAFQQNDYTTVLDLLSKAQAKGYAPEDQTEWYPFIKSFALTGDWQKASDLTSSLEFNHNKVLRSGLCQIWQGFEQAGMTDPAIQPVLVSLDCSH